MEKGKGPCVIHWHRRDLRIADNLSLHHAAGSGLPVVPVYVLSTWKKEHSWTGSIRQEFLCGCLESLGKNLDTIGGRLIFRKGDAVEELKKLIRETGAVAIHTNADPDPFGKSVEKKLGAACEELGVGFHLHDDVSLHTPGQILTQSGDPYRVYTPYAKNWLSQDKPSPVAKPSDLKTPPGISSLDLPDVRHWGLRKSGAEILEPGEKAARDRLTDFLRKKAGGYADKRDFPSMANTSRLSQDLRFGLVSIRTIFSKTMKARAEASSSAKNGIDVFIKELAWREFYFAILHHYPEILDHEFNPDWRGLWWAEPGKSYEAWQKGRTGFPIVDAGMRELLATGFMHNRVRMITAMFLTKDLHIDWRHGESFFMRHLADGEIASNNGGWQWSAGTGADAAPYFRIQNPWTQTSRYDPDGSYIRKWIPELKNCDPSLFTAPPKDGKPIAKDYPLPVVDHRKERDRTLEIFKRHKEKIR